MNKQDLTKEISAYIANKLFGNTPPSDFNNDTLLISSRLLNSIVVLVMLSDFEEKYKVAFEAHEVTVDNLNSINIISDFIFQKLGK